ncbi:MAG: MarR family transcriptional regulator [Clostridia bacterium]|nr:MarR family transcriptional regulator [Clostridia bacterium]MBQ8371254.1 MarR family transcriptional regulator [Clostridia bacterium]MBQ8513429.1 MarR family transcriptional regulator [Clostridia bacterium]
MSDMIDLKTARVFLNFMVQYYALIRRHIVEANQFRFQSHGFSMLYTLRNHKGEPLTMTEFAKELGITKQQLTKLVNDLEDQNYVRRAHNTENRRQVYIEITDEGIAALDYMLGEILHEIIKTLEDFSEEDKEKIREYVGALSEMLERDAVNCQRKQEETKEK